MTDVGKTYQKMTLDFNADIRPVKEKSPIRTEQLCFSSRRQEASANAVRGLRTCHLSDNEGFKAPTKLTHVFILSLHN